MAIEPIQGTPVWMPPGRVAVRMDAEHQRAYRVLYSRYGTVLGGLPVLRERDFDGRRVILKSEQLRALNEALSKVEPAASDAAGSSAFTTQERAKNRLFKRLQYLS
ncbi:MAG TPA: hypothetical protein VEZ14_14925 [Dehalococcoidia bacterium]|nr:hypothetical protein [Dehalococcoidia bacterium]